ncbi:chromosomal replication initiator protein DnaA, partial [bacterium]|nr:chromosomal replication initiator protein DnaA [bacterium]
KESVNARKYAIFLSREILDLSYQALAKEFQKNHTTILYQYERFKKDCASNKALSVVCDEIKNLIQD